MIARNRFLILVLVFAMSLSKSIPLFAQSEAKPADTPSAEQVSLDAIQSIRELLEMPGEAIDLASAKLTIDKLIDPNIDVDASLAEIEGFLKIDAGRTVIAVDFAPIDGTVKWGQVSFCAKGRS